MFGLNGVPAIAGHYNIQPLVEKSTANIKASLVYEDEVVEPGVHLGRTIRSAHTAVSILDSRSFFPVGALLAVLSVLGASCAGGEEKHEI